MKLSLAELRAFDPDYRERGEETVFLCPFGECNGKRRRTMYANSAGLFCCQRCGGAGLLEEYKRPRSKRANLSRVALSAFD